LREERLKKRNDIREVFGKGKRIGCRGAKLFVLKNNLPHNRICFTFSRGFGTAVKRNRAKRLGREAYRNIKPRLCCGYDLILLVYPDDADATFAGRMKQLELLLSRAGLLQ
jgi:ribonuclease P protein component